MTLDLTTPSARGQRDTLVANTDVLDKVKALMLMPDGIHAMTEQAAHYFEVPVETIWSLVKDNREEIEADGYVVLEGASLASFKEASGITSRARSIALFPRRAILRVAMLLRDSAIARRIRDLLLDIEQVAREMSDDEIVMRALQIQGRKIEILELENAEMKPKAEFYDELMEADGNYSTLATSKILGWGRNVMMRDLRRIGILQGNNLPYQRYEHHFKVVPGTYVNQKTGDTVPTATTYVRPSGLEFLRKKLNRAPAVVEAVRA